MKLTEATGIAAVTEAKKAAPLSRERHHALPHIDPTDPNYEKHCDLADYLEKHNPSLYKKMMAWG